MGIEIFPDLWIGDLSTAMNTKFLSEKKIEFIINCGKDLEFNEKYKIVDNLRIPIDDNDLLDSNLTLYDLLDEIVTKIHTILSQGKAVFIYCYAGTQQSVAIVVAYIMKYGHVSIKTAIGYVRSKHPKAFRPSINFEPCLQKYEHKITTLSKIHI